MLIGLQLPGSKQSPSFGFGRIDFTAQASGKVDVCIDSLIMGVNSTDSTLKASFSNNELRPLIPDDLHKAMFSMYFSNVISAKPLTSSILKGGSSFTNAFARVSPFVA